MYRENKRSKKNNQNRLLFKSLICMAGIVALIFVAFTYKNYRMKENKAPFVHVKEVMPFMEALSEVNEENIPAENQNALNVMQNRFGTLQNEAEAYLSFGELQVILQAFPIEADDLRDEYKSDSWDVSVADWNRVVESLAGEYGNGRIVVQDTLLLGNEEYISDEERVPVAKDRIFTGKELLINRFWRVQDFLFSNVRAVIYEGSLLTVTGYAEEAGALKNVYFSDVSDGKIHLFYGGYHMLYPTGVFKDMAKQYEDGQTIRSITDIYYEKGKISIGEPKADYIHGKLLQADAGSVEIEGYGKFQTDENMQIYKAYGELASMDREDMRIGYAFSDFVVEDGKIAACLIIKEEDMDYIRVLLKNSDLAGRYHEEVSGYCTQDCEWIEYEDGVEKSRIVIPKGERFRIGKEDIERSGKRIKIIPCVLSGELALESVRRSSGTPVYKGSLEITGDAEGLLLVNEVLLEDYLCKVVPSEMPSFYPKEALMAQAVCARTYAYSKMLHAGLPQYGAHVDDSAGFQVYNNITEQASTTEAVKATHNMIAVYEDEPIGAYYYSTSCGMGSDTRIWHGTADTPAYLQAKEIGSTGDTDKEGVAFSDVEYSPQALTKEENFKEWILGVKDSHFEAEEGWYRWTYEVSKLDAEHLQEVLKNRYSVNPNLILTKKGQEFESMEIQDPGEITDMEIVKRLPGGVADELIITGTKASIKVISELNIRYVLSDGISKVHRQTGDEADAVSTLPSAFIVLDTVKEDNAVTGYKIIGGGFGHGVGMSQNGARNMAMEGMNCEEILTFFYPGATLKTLKFEGK